MPKQKYFTEEQRKQARREASKRWRIKNTIKIKEIQDKWAKEKGFNGFKDYAKTQNSYQSRLKNTEPEKFKTLFDSKPKVTKQHPVYTDYYVDTKGNFWKFSTKRKAWIKITPYQNESGYCTINLYIGSKRYLRFHHQVVLEAWVGPRPMGMEVDHIDRNKANNAPKNLRWVTKQQNLNRRILKNGKTYK